MILAHRGGGGIEPEATVPTMVGTYMRNPAVVIEFDVHKSRDGEIVVMHDATVDRTTNGTGRVSDLTLTELKALDAGYCATPNQGNGTAETGQCHAADAAGFPFRGMGYQVPTLQEVLAALPDEAFLSIELKQSGTEREVADLLRASGRLAKMIVGAEFDDMAARNQGRPARSAGISPDGRREVFRAQHQGGLGLSGVPGVRSVRVPAVWCRFGPGHPGRD